MNEAYLAGLIDADGSVSVTKNQTKKSYSYSTRLSLSNTDLSLIEEVQAVYGGTITTRSTRSNWKTQYQLYFRNHEQRQVFELILPYLRTKKKRAQLAYKLLTEFNSKDEQEDIYQQVKQLNKRGYDHTTRR